MCNNRHPVDNTTATVLVSGTSVPSPAAKRMNSRDKGIHMQPLISPASGEVTPLMTQVPNTSHIYPIKDLGLVFNDSLGDNTHRVSVSVVFDNTVKDSLAILRRNFDQYVTNPRHCLRMRVVGAKYWYTDVSVSSLFDELVHVGNAQDGKALRRGDRRDREAPLAYCFLEDTGSGTRNTWMFRHDLIDGFRVCQQILPISFEKCNMVTKKLADRYHASVKKQSNTRKAINVLATVPSVLCRLPGSIYTFVKICCAKNKNFPPNVQRRPMYLHLECPLTSLRQSAKEQGVPSLNNFINAALVIAFFAAQQKSQRTMFAINCISEFTAKTGNGTCIKVCDIPRQNGSIAATAETIQSQTNSLYNTIIYLFTRFYAQNYSKFPKWFRNWFGQRHDQFDFLVSNIPAFDVGAVPTIKGYETVRESLDWAPNIGYIVGNEDKLYFDFYFNVPDSFNREAFQNKLSTVIEADNTCTTNEYPRYF